MYPHSILSRFYPQLHHGPMMTKLDVLFFLGRPFSPLYGLAMRLRAALYARRILPSHSLPVPVISVGNLTMGGTGKTPTVALIAEYLLGQGYKPAIISRGYGGTARLPVNIVADGSRQLLEAEFAGDEPAMLAQTVPRAIIITGKKRIDPCRYAIERYGCNILILDDGFQHLAVQRDINLVLFNATTLAGDSRIFPGGELREPVAALKRADAFVLTGCTTTNRPRAERFGQLLQQKFGEVPVFYLENCPAGVAGDKGPAQPLSLPQPLLAFSGIAHPQRFYEMLAVSGIGQAATLDFDDHVRYGSREISRIIAAATTVGAKGLITTAKDRVKLDTAALPLPLYHLRLATCPAPALYQFLEERLGQAPPPPNP